MMLLALGARRRCDGQPAADSGRPRSCGRRCSPARSIFASNIPATPRSSSIRRAIRSGARRKAGYARAAALDYAANRLVWLQPAPADNSWVIAIPNALARRKGLNTLEDFAAFVRAGERVRLAASAEFVESVAGLPAFEAAYGFKLRANQLLVLSGGETTATMKAAADGISGVNAAMAYGSDGALNALDLLALEDPRHAEPVYAPAPVIRAATLEGLAAGKAGCWRRFSPASTSRPCARLNEKVAVEGEDAGRRRARLPLDAEPVVTRGADAPDRVLLTLFCAGAAALDSLWLRHACGQPYRRWRSALLVAGAMAGRRRDSCKSRRAVGSVFRGAGTEPRRGGAARGRRLVLRLPRGAGHFADMLALGARPAARTSLGAGLLDPDCRGAACNARRRAARRALAGARRARRRRALRGFRVDGRRGASSPISRWRGSSPPIASNSRAALASSGARRRGGRAGADLQRATDRARAAARAPSRPAFRRARNRADHPLHRSVRRVDRAAFGARRALSAACARRA